MHPLLIVLIFVVAMASPAIVAVKYTARPKRELARVHRPEPRRLSGLVEGSVVLPVCSPATVRARLEPRQLAPVTPIKSLPASTSDRRR
jgi:hypothetical protein